MTSSPARIMTWAVVVLCLWSLASGHETSCRSSGVDSIDYRQRRRIQDEVETLSDQVTDDHGRILASIEALSDQIRSLETRCGTTQHVPEGLWPLTDKFVRASADMTGHGHDAVMFNMAPGTADFPGTTTHAYRFAGNVNSYLEIPNNGLTARSFTVTMYFYKEVDTQMPLFHWDDADSSSLHGTHIWSIEGGLLIFRLVGPNGRMYDIVSQPGQTLNKWTRLFVSYNYVTGHVTLCVADACSVHDLQSANVAHRTSAVIRFGVRKAAYDARTLRGEVACLAYYDHFIPDPALINYDQLKATCF